MGEDFVRFVFPWLPAKGFDDRSRKGYRGRPTLPLTPAPQFVSSSWRTMV